MRPWKLARGGGQPAQLSEAWAILKISSSLEPAVLPAQSSCMALYKLSSKLLPELWGRGEGNWPPPPCYEKVKNNVIKESIITHAQKHLKQWLPYLSNFDNSFCQSSVHLNGAIDVLVSVQSIYRAHTSIFAKYIQGTYVNFCKVYIGHICQFLQSIYRAHTSIFVEYI